MLTQVDTHTYTLLMPDFLWWLDEIPIARSLALTHYLGQAKAQTV